MRIITDNTYDRHLVVPIKNISLSFAYSNHSIRKEVNDAYINMANQAKQEGIQLIDPKAFISITDNYEVMNRNVKINEE